MLSQHAGDDVGHGLVLESSPVGAQVETRQSRFDHGGVAGTAKAVVTRLPGRACGRRGDLILDFLCKDFRPRCFQLSRGNSFLNLSITLLKCSLFGSMRVAGS